MDGHISPTATSLILGFQVQIWKASKEDSEPGNSKQLLFLLLSQTFSKKSVVRDVTDLKRKNSSKLYLTGVRLFSLTN